MNIRNIIPYVLFVVPNWPNILKNMNLYRTDLFLFLVTKVKMLIKIYYKNIMILVIMTEKLCKLL